MNLAHLYYMYITTNLYKIKFYAKVVTITVYCIFVQYTVISEQVAIFFRMFGGEKLEKNSLNYRSPNPILFQNAR